MQNNRNSRVQLSWMTVISLGVTFIIRNNFSILITHFSTNVLPSDPFVVDTQKLTTYSSHTLWKQTSPLITYT